MPKGAPNPAAVSSYQSYAPSRLHFSPSTRRTHKGPVSQPEELCKRVEWDVASWTLRIVVWRAELCASGVEATAAKGGGEACGGGSGEHLGRSVLVIVALREVCTLNSSSWV